MRFFILFVIAWLSLHPARAQDNSSLTGKIAFIGSDSNVYIYDTEDQTIRSITSDGSTIQKYQWPVWSPDGRLAFFCCDLRTASTPVTSGYVFGPNEETKQIFRGTAESVIYASWAPSSCGAGCYDLMLLINNVFSGSLYIQQVRDEITRTSSRVLARGQPFYFSWSPDGRRLALHRNNRIVDIYSLDAENTINALRRTSSGTFQTPAWSPVDDRILFGASGTGGSGTNLTVSTGEADRILVENLPGFVSFLWSPDGNYIAYRVIDANRFGALFVLDAITGELIARTTSDVIAFFWSPDSKRIAYVTTTATPGAFSAQIPQTLVRQNERARFTLAWSVIEIASGVNRRYTSFIPTGEMLYLIQYFDQFAVSHRVWSPNGTHILYSEYANADQPVTVVSILNTIQADSVPFVIADGTFAVWSFR